MKLGCDYRKSLETGDWYELLYTSRWYCGARASAERSFRVQNVTLEILELDTPVPLRLPSSQVEPYRLPGELH